MKETPTQKRYNNIDFSIMHDAGFKLLAFSIMMCEDTFYFETEEEADDAWKYFENGADATGEYTGFWYSVEDIENNKEEYKEEIGYEPEIIYLNETV